MQAFWADLRYALRNLGHRAQVSSVAVISLGLGIGATLAVFAVFDGVLLRPLPYRDPAGLAMVWTRWTAFEKTWLAEAEVLDYRTGIPSMAELAAWTTTSVTITGDGNAERALEAQVTANTFHVLGVEPQIGRTFTEDEDAPKRNDTVILGHALWQRRFGGDPNIVGKVVRVDGAARQVVGVMPATFILPLDLQEAQPSELFVPLGEVFENTPDDRGGHYLFAVGRLVPGATAARATSELHALTKRLTSEGAYPEAMQFDAFAVSLDDQIFGGVRPYLVLLTLAVLFLLAIACTNVINMQLAHAEGRRRDVGIRTALGANRWVLVRASLAESLIIAFLSALVGLAVAALAITALGQVDTIGIPRLDDVVIGPRVALLATLLVTLTAAVFTLAATMGATPTELVDVLKEGSHGSAGVVRARTRSVLVVVQFTVAIVLLVSAGLVARSLWKLRQIDVGFNPDHVITAQLSLSPDAYATPEQVTAFFDRLRHTLAAQPGVESVGLVRNLPLANEIGDWGLDVEGYVESPGQNAKGDWQVATTGYFEAMGEHLVRGRFFNESDVADGAQVAVINETMARMYWEGRDALGGRLRMGADNVERPWVTVVGIVRDVKHNGLTGIVKEKFYRPQAQFHRSTGNIIRGMTLVIRSSLPIESLAPTIRRETTAMDPNVPIARVRTMEEVLAAATAGPRFTSWLMGLFATFALLLGAVGVYGVLSYLVSRRTRELGVHIALGATSGQVRRLVLGQGLRLAVVGMAVGVAGAIASARLMRSMLYGVQPLDPLTFLGAPALLLLAAILASALPARRACRIDPVIALRSE